MLEMLEIKSFVIPIITGSRVLGTPDFSIAGIRNAGIRNLGIGNVQQRALRPVYFFRDTSGDLCGEQDIIEDRKLLFRGVSRENCELCIGFSFRLR